MAKEKTRERTFIPKYWASQTESTIGFKNPRNLCYRNVTFQMLLHAPVFLNWINWYKNHHAPAGHPCLGTEGSPCKICLFHDISTRYWASAENCDAALDTLSREIFLACGGSEEDMDGEQEQDAPEYCEQQVYEQLKEDTKAMFKQDLDDIFMIGTVEKITCNGCGLKTESDETKSMFLRVHLPADSNGNGKKGHSIEEPISRYFVPTPYLPVCKSCFGFRTSQPIITQLPEMLLVQLDRQDKNGTRRYDLINLGDLMIDKNFTNAKADVKYELTSVILHQRDPKKEVEEIGGHYSVLVKGLGGSWTHVSDAKRNKMSDEELKTSDLSRENGYVFAYRRLPYKADSDDSGYDTTGSSPSTIGKDQLSQDEPIPQPSQPSTGSEAMDIALTYMTKLIRNIRAQNKKDWEAQRGKRKQEWDDWADEREKKKKKQGSQADDSDVVYDEEKLRGTLRVSMTDKQGGTSLDIQMAGQIKNNLKEVDTEETKQAKQTKQPKQPKQAKQAKQAKPAKPKTEKPKKEKPTPKRIMPKRGKK